MSENDWCNCSPTCHCTPPNSEWISVKEKSPPIDCRFLSYDGNDYDIMIWNEKGWYCSVSCNCCNGHCTTYFTHWIPLPNPPSY